MSLYLVRHARTVPDRERPVETWPLAGDDLGTLRAWREHLPQHDDSAWWSSTEPKATGTAAALTARPVGSCSELGEARRGGWCDDYDAVVRRFLDDEDVAPAPGWESARDAGVRFETAVRRSAASPARDVVVVAHGLVITLFRARVTRVPTTVPMWKSLRFPDVLVLSEPERQAWVADPASPCTLSRPDWAVHAS